MFLQYIALKNCRILQCTVKFYMHLLYILQYNVNFTGVGWQIGCQYFYCKINSIFLQCGEMCSLEESYKNCKKIQNFKVLRAPKQVVCLWICAQYHYHREKRCYIAGDFNLHLLKYDRSAPVIYSLNLMYAYYFFQCIDTPDRVVPGPKGTSILLTDKRDFAIFVFVNLIPFWAVI